MSNKPILINALNFVDERLVGAGVFFRNLLSEWLVRERNDLTILHSSGIDFKNIFFVSDGKVKFWPVPIKNFIVRIFFEQLVLPFKLRPFAVYYSPTPAIPLLAKWISPKTKLIVTIHDMIPFFVSGKYSYARSLYVKAISKYGARVADHVVTVSENSKKDICSIAAINPNKVTVIYNFIPEAQYERGTTNARFFVSISTIEPGKNLEKTMEGFSQFVHNQNYSDFKFYWIGKIGWGYSQEDLKQLLIKFNIEEKFIFTGFINDAHKADLLSSCAAMVYLSHYEGFGLPVLEALHYHKPSLVSNISSLPEIIGDSGLVCDQNSGSAIAAGMKELVEHLREFEAKTPGQFKKFSKDKQIEKFASII